MFNVSIVFIYRRKEQNANPGAAIQAIKYYNYSIKKKQSGTFKPLVTEEAIKEESEEIENILGIFFLHAIHPCAVLLFCLFYLGYLHNRIKTLQQGDPFIVAHPRNSVVCALWLIYGCINTIKLIQNRMTLGCTHFVG